MAATRKIYIDPNDTGLWKVKQTPEAAKKVSELLQQDLEVSNSLGSYSYYWVIPADDGRVDTPRFFQ